MTTAKQDHQHWQPATFRERGVAVPFTSPALAGARARLMPRGCELVLPHPGGVRGVYIFALAALSEVCTPTMHDARLASRIAGLQDITPREIRLAGREIAMEGAAGRAASAAAGRAAEQEAADCHAFSSALIQAVTGHTHQFNQTGPGSPDVRLQRAVQKLAGGTSRDPTAVTSDINRLADMLASAGLDPIIATKREPGAHGRCDALLRALRDMRESLFAWSGTTRTGITMEILHAVEVAIKAAELSLNAAQAALKAPSTLLEAWASAPHDVAATMSRPEWLLDGWDHICLLWQCAEPDEKHEALAEIALIVPPFPMEASGWLGPSVSLGPQLSHRLRHASNGGHLATQQALIARNERLRALIA